MPGILQVHQQLPASGTTQTTQPQHLAAIGAVLGSGANTRHQVLIARGTVKAGTHPTVTSRTNRLPAQGAVYVFDTARAMEINQDIANDLTLDLRISPDYAINFPGGPL